MVVFDACVFSIAIYEDAGIPVDYRTGRPIDRARDRVDELIRGLEADGDCILLPAPALGEALASVAEHAEQFIEEIEQNNCFKIHPFGKREAIEIAVRTKSAILAGDKKEGIAEPWQKMKYDRQIVASAKTEGATVIYSTDKHIHSHAGLWGIRVTHIADLPLPASEDQQAGMFEGGEDEEPQQDPVDVRESDNGHSEDQSGAETAKNTASENNAEERKEEVTGDQPNTKAADGDAVTASLSPAAPAENGKGQESVPGSGEAKTSSAPPPSVSILPDRKSETPVSDQDGAPGAAPAAIPAPTAHNVSAKEQTNNE